MFLIVIKGTNVGTVFPLGTGRILVGRAEDCNIKIPDLLVSRKHCLIEERDNNFYIKDLNSTNKTIVNNRIVEDEDKLKTGDIIEIGDTAFLFTDQKKISVRSVVEYNKLIQSQTRMFDKTG